MQTKCILCGLINSPTESKCRRCGSDLASGAAEESRWIADDRGGDYNPGRPRALIQPTHGIASRLRPGAVLISIVLTVPAVALLNSLLEAVAPNLSMDAYSWLIGPLSAQSFVLLFLLTSRFAAYRSRRSKSNRKAPGVIQRQLKTINRDEALLVEDMAISNCGREVSTEGCFRMTGKLLLTNRRLIFLSSGNSESRLSHSSFPIVFLGLGGVGGLVSAWAGRRADLENLYATVEDLSMTALTKLGSWSYDLSQIRGCVAEPRGLHRPHLRLEPSDPTDGYFNVLYGPHLSPDHMLQLANQIRLAADIR